MKTFKWIPNKGMRVDNEPRLVSVSFGNGYSQDRPDGINFRLRTFSLTFRHNTPEVNEMIAFLEEHQGYLPFLWKHPLTGKVLKVKARKWPADITGIVDSFDVEFKEQPYAN